MSDLTFAELPIGTHFEVTDLKASFPMFHAPLVRTRAGKWAPPRHLSWTLDYNAERLNPRGDDWDRCWVNSNYRVKELAS